LKTRKPTSQEIEELITFLPRLYAEGFAPIKQWHGGIPDQDGVIQMPWADYDEIVIEFIVVAERECWTDPKYISKEVGQMLKDKDDAIETADLNEVKTITAGVVSVTREVSPSHC
jgi:hypothetical protein